MAEQNLQIKPWLQVMLQVGGSDLHVKPGAPPRIRLNGELVPLEVSILTAAQVETLVSETLIAPKVRALFDETNEADYSLSVHEVGRFRVNAFRARSTAGMILRHIRENPYTLGELGMPEVISKMALVERGLLLVTGPTGSGKTTTLAAIVDLINETRQCHILTIEDPIEVLHKDKKSSVNQREIRTDTFSFDAALRGAMRQDPDVILIGEMRDAETVRAALQAAETGHFVLSTLHTKTAMETVNRIVDFFPPHEQRQIRWSLASSLTGIICQRLVEKYDGRGRIAVMEILVNTARVSEAIADIDKTSEIEEIISEGDYYGMQTFDQHLLRLVLSQDITVPAARRAATNPTDFDIHLRRAGIDVRELEGLV